VDWSELLAETANKRPLEDVQGGLGTRRASAKDGDAVPAAGGGGPAGVNGHAHGGGGLDDWAGTRRFAPGCLFAQIGVSIKYASPALVDEIKAACRRDLGGEEESEFVVLIIS
jgi:hypothetical protein